MLSYLFHLSKGKTILWCYLLWYLTVLFFYFDPAPRIWINSAGISLIIGFALMLSVAPGKGTLTDHWQTFRLFAMPFCVSSFSSLIKGQGFLFVIPPQPSQVAVAVSVCVVFVLLVAALKTLNKRKPHEQHTQGSGQSAA